jgi:[acyl-carrier-protein] S-malonyltransferase
VRGTRELSCAIVIDEDACVVGGTERALAAVTEAARRAGAQVTCLRVGIASHTPLLAVAATEFRALLEAAPLRAPVRPVACGIDGSWVTTRERAVGALSEQIARTIEWSRCIDAFVRARLPVFLELGPGSCPFQDGAQTASDRSKPGRSTSFATPAPSRRGSCEAATVVG